MCLSAQIITSVLNTVTGKQKIQFSVASISYKATMCDTVVTAQGSRTVNTAVLQLKSPKLL